jgi:RNA polymerase sigma factor (sigma-70 family)
VTLPAAAVEAVWRIESGRLVAALTRITGDFSAAEDLAQDALERALRQWPDDGIPDHPASWLMATAKHLAVDSYRRRRTLDRKVTELGQATLDAQEEDPMAAVDEDLDNVVPDDLLRLIFLTCHPALTIESQVALTLRTVGGLTTREIARAFLVPEPTVGQRISRAKKTLADRQVRFELPPRAELPDRLGAVLAVVYLVFNEGYAATSGDAWARPELCHDALRLGRLLVSLQPDEPEVHGLVALMELQASRIAARTGPAGEALLLADQDRRRWDHLLVRRGLAALETAEALGTGPYTLQAAIAACHARASSVESTDWRRVAALYTVLQHLAPSPVVALNRAVAVGMAEGPDRGLALTLQLEHEPALAGYPQLAAVRATFLQRLGRLDEAREQFRHAAECTANASQRALYLAQAENLSSSLVPEPPPTSGAPTGPPASC